MIIDISLRPKSAITYFNNSNPQFSNDRVEGQKQNMELAFFHKSGRLVHFFRPKYEKKMKINFLTFMFNKSVYS